MDKREVDEANLYAEQVPPTDGPEVNLLLQQGDRRMLNSDIVERIREMFGQGYGNKRIARLLRISRNSVRRYLAGAKAGSQERPAARRLDDVAVQKVHRLFNTVAEGNAVVVQQELASQGIEVDLRTLQRVIAPLRQEARAKALATVRFETKPGEQMQIDFGQKDVLIAGQRVRVHLMSAVLGYSRRLYCHAFLAERQDDWLEGIERACRHFEGLPDQILCDNASPLVNSHNPRTGEVVWHPGFAIFCKDRGITPRACKPCRARTKGKIERGVGYIKRNALAGRTFPSFEVLQQHLTRWAIEVADCRVHGTIHERPRDRFERDERKALRPLPVHKMAVRTRRLCRRVAADCFVDVDTVRYSVPYLHVKQTVEVVVGLEYVEILLRGSPVARHLRSFEPYAEVRDSSHFQGIFRAPSPPETIPVVPQVPDRIARSLTEYAAIVEGGQS